MAIDYELLLFDRLKVIRDVLQKYGVDNFYLSFSGGKDSTVLHYLLDLALPGNNIPRVYIDTGIEYLDVRNFVYSLANNDNRIFIIKSSRSIKQTLEQYGYPFKSKLHSLRVEQFNKGSNANFIRKYIGGFTAPSGKPSSFVCPKSLLYQFEVPGRFHYSNKCCYKLKKEPVRKWESANNRHIAITGMRSQEGGTRKRLGCVIFDTNKRLIHFHPLIKVDEGFEDYFLNKYGIRLCRLYYPPFSFKRTGCKGCPYSLDLQEQLTLMSLYLPNERIQCEVIWKPVYSEYRRIGYRLDSNEQLVLF